MFFEVFVVILDELVIGFVLVDIDDDIRLVRFWVDC